ncbi:uncharacterized protein N0V89_004838 [Didymosphaeria variabile]|uniref:Uncharacterized protein n=1 Tax=Didymosphaeria variabile TaxID=1932322 RepID=A0A9W9CDY3_9PLEO|nr:uncharacterized protein N0V89_004838 [Didymosphaeria variabile]KAJ4356801.1 hypothetical protein N0V89_004838 [Didymosphaeria variabile]
MSSTHQIRERLHYLVKNSPSTLSARQDFSLACNLTYILQKFCKPVDVDDINLVLIQASSTSGAYAYAYELTIGEQFVFGDTLVSTKEKAMVALKEASEIRIFNHLDLMKREETSSETGRSPAGSIEL